MSREGWNLIKQSKRFYVTTYRKAVSALFLSLIFNVVFALAVYYVYFTQPEHDFYATDVITPPVQLTYLYEPNNSSVPLLASDQDDNYVNKVIPQ